MHANPNPSVTDFDFRRENSKVCFVAHETVFRASTRLAPDGGKNYSEVVIFKERSMETKKQNKGGRPTLDDPAKHRHVLYLNDRENARFLSQWEQSGVTSKSRFIAARLFGEPFRVVKVDKSAVEYCARLTEFYAQFRAVAVNYNQVVKALHSNFSEKKALAFLYKLEKATTELAMLNRQVIELTNECKELWLPK